MADTSVENDYVTWETCFNCTFFGESVKVDIVHKSTEFLIVMVIFMVVAIVGNTTILVIIGKSGGCQRPVSMFMMALAIGDILIATLSMSTEIAWEQIGQLTYGIGSFACKSSTYIQCLLFASTAFMLMSMSYDRYEAICKPLDLSRSVAQSRRLIIGSWILGSVVAIPQIFVFLLVQVGTHSDGSPKFSCRSQGYSAAWQRKLYLTCLAAYIFLIPLCFMGFCGIRIANVIWNNSKPASIPNMGRNDANRKTLLSHAKIRTIQLTICILVSYIACWSPYFTVTLMNAWTDYSISGRIPRSVGIIAQCGAWFSSCINPFIYGLFNLNLTKVRQLCCPIKPKFIVQLDYDHRNGSGKDGRAMSNIHRNSACVLLMNHSALYNSQHSLSNQNSHAGKNYRLRTSSSLL